MGLALVNAEPHSVPIAVPAGRKEKVGRNTLCPCDSGRKYKKCCLERDQRQQRALVAAASQAGLPEWITKSRDKLPQFEKYVCQTFDLPRLLKGFTDSRRDPDIPTFDVANSLFHTALFRIPSINALEGDLKEADFQKLIGRIPRQDVKAFSAKVVANTLDKLDLIGVFKAITRVFWQAERNKAFREQTYGCLRCAAVDGWEPFSSFHRHCPDCLERQVEVKKRGGKKVLVTQYYHRYVVAVLVGPLLDIVLFITPVRNKAARIRAGEKNPSSDEGELTAALRLIDRLHETYGTFIDALIFDSLYPNGPVLTKLTEYGYGAFIIMKKEHNEPLKEALALWQGRPPCKVVDDPDSKEHIKFWETDEIQTLDTYKGKIRVIRAEVTHPKEEKRTWCVAVIGDRARRTPLTVALKATRARWHIENTAFNQWIKYWNLNHVFRHTASALMAVLLIWSLVFNLLQFFIYRRLKRPRRPKDPTYTIRHIVEVMLRQIATLPEPFPWAALLDTS
jgi:hypothetical protein